MKLTRVSALAIRSMRCDRAYTEAEWVVWSEKQQALIRRYLSE